MLEISNDQINVKASDVVELSTDLPEVDVNVSKSITAEIAPDTYVISSSGYSGNVPTGIAAWVANAITQSAGGNLLEVLDNIRTTLMGEIQSGVNQVIQQVENDYVSQAALVTTIGSTRDYTDAAILNVNQTIADGDAALASNVSGLKARLGDDGAGGIESFIGNVALTRVDADSALATNVSTLQTSYNDLNVSLSSVDALVAGYFKEWDGVSNPEVGMYKFVAAVQYIYAGDFLGWIPSESSNGISTILSSIQTTTGVSLAELQAQIDGEISSWFYNGAPDQVSLPWSEWIATDTSNGNTLVQDTHLGDLYFDLETQAAYRFVKDSGTGIYGWGTPLSDVLVTKALADAASAQVFANKKSTVYLKSATEINAITSLWTIQEKEDNIGDIWVEVLTNVTKIWNGSTWIASTTLGADTALAKLVDLEEARDGVVNTFYTETAPTIGMSYGDYWVDTDSWTGAEYIVYRYEALDASSTGVLDWRVNRGETSVALWRAYRADVAGSAAGLAQTTANTASIDATSALGKLTDIASDNILSQVEKSVVIANYSVITSEQSGIDTQATNYGITTEKTAYDTAVTNLTTYLNTLTTPVAWNVVTGDTTIVGTTFRAKFNDVYTTRQAVLNAITAKAKLLTDSKVTTWYQLNAPIGLTGDDVGDIWVHSGTKVTQVWAPSVVGGVDYEWRDITNTSADNARNGQLSNAPEASPPTATGKNDVWVVTDRWYNDAGTVVTVSGPTDTTLGQYSPVTKVYNGTVWVQQTLAQSKSLNVQWVGSSSKFITAPDGSITGWGFADGSGIPKSEFVIRADKFKVSDSIGGSNPIFTVDTDTRDAIFNGKVTFTSGGTKATGTINEAITANIEQVAVGDKNINITDNLIPTTSLLTDINNAGYQFIGDPIKASASGIATFAEPQIVLDIDDEVYSPFVDELAAAYYYRFGIYGVTNLNSFGVHTVDAVDAVTETNLAYNMLDGNTIAVGAWYIIDGIINPKGGDATSYSGSIRTADGTKIGEVRNIAMPAGAEQLVLGWQYDATISRPKLAKITADTLTSSFATSDYVNSEFPSYTKLLDPNLSLIDGGTIIAGSSITSPVINAGIVNSSEINSSDINGGSITGTLITGAIIKASYIDYSSVESLTNWAVVTDMNTIAVQYWSNFAQDDRRIPIPDINGKYRLYTTTPLIGSIKSGTLATAGASVNNNTYTYDHYTLPGEKLITTDANFQTSGQILHGKLHNFYFEYGSGTCEDEFKIFGDIIVVKGVLTRNHFGNGNANTGSMYVRVSVNGITQVTRYVPGHGTYNLSNTFSYNGINYTLSTSFSNNPLLEYDYENSYYTPSIVEYTLSITVPAPFNCLVKTGYSGELFSYRNVSRSLNAGVGGLSYYTYGGYTGDTHSVTSDYAMHYTTYGQYTGP